MVIKWFCQKKKLNFFSELNLAFSFIIDIIGPFCQVSDDVDHAISGRNMQSCHLKVANIFFKIGYNGKRNVKFVLNL